MNEFAGRMLPDGKLDLNEMTSNEPNKSMPTGVRPFFSELGEPQAATKTRLSLQALGARPIIVSIVTVFIGGISVLSALGSVEHNVRMLITETLGVGDKSQLQATPDVSTAKNPEPTNKANTAISHSVRVEHDQPKQGIATDAPNPRLQRLIGLASAFRPAKVEQAAQIEEALRSITAKDRIEFKPGHTLAENDLRQALQILEVEKNGLSAAKDKNMSVGVTSGTDRYDQSMARSLKEWLNGNGYTVDQVNPTLLLRVKIANVATQDTVDQDKLQSATLVTFASWRWKGQMTEEIQLPPIDGTGAPGSSQSSPQATVFEELTDSFAKSRPL